METCSGQYGIILAALKVIHVNTCLLLLHASHKTMDYWINAAQLYLNAAHRRNTATRDKLVVPSTTAAASSLAQVLPKETLKFIVVP